MVLLDGGRHRAADADPVGPHDGRPGLPLLVGELAREGRRVLRPELEDVADLDAARDLERLAAARAGIARRAPARTTAHSETGASRSSAKPRDVPVAPAGARHGVDGAADRLVGDDARAPPAAGAGRRSRPERPVAFSTLSSEASARCSTPSAFFKATSLTSRSPRTKRDDEAPARSRRRGT